MQAVFVDRDGVINRNRPDHVKTWAEFEFLPGALDGLARFARAGLPVFVITNQAVVNRGLVSRRTEDALNRRMLGQIESGGGRVEAVAYCPHRPDEACVCRKPRPGLLRFLARLYDLDLQETVVVGDALADLEAGQAAGCSTVLVLTGRGREQLALAEATGRNGFRVAADLDAAATLIVGATPTPLDA